MKSILLNKIKPSQQESFVIHSKIYQAYSLWHHHTEYEILYITKHSGTAYVGDKILSYDEGSLILFCANLSHMLVPKLNHTDLIDDGEKEAYTSFSGKMITKM
jgi:mannose-6-phosphate isomerase-like protein (cupin superfamily)